MKQKTKILLKLEVTLIIIDQFFAYTFMSIEKVIAKSLVI